VRQLLDVVHQAVELPLRVDFGSASQGEAIQFLVRSEIAEHWLHGSEAPADHLASALGIDLTSHAIGRGVLRLGVLAGEDGYLSDQGALGVA